MIEAWILVYAQVKLWDVSTEQPTLVATSDLAVGPLFSAAFCAESPFLVAGGGAKVRCNATVNFAARLWHTVLP